MPDEPRLDDISFDFPQPADAAKEKSLKLWATYYYVYGAKAAGAGVPLLNKNGGELGPKLSVRDFCLAAIEGTVRVAGADGGGATYNFASRGGTSQCDCAPFASSLKPAVKAALGKTRWEVAKGPFGTGVQNMLLVPYRSIAVDKGHIPYGSVVYIPQARGQEVTLASGRVAKHDGYFYAADTGGAIKNNHIDVFSGVFTKNPFKNFVKSKETATFDAFLIKDAGVAAALAGLHGKS
jgi:3D (Asp-Asp-Asp) domain-containing protein